MKAKLSLICVALFFSSMVKAQTEFEEVTSTFIEGVRWSTIVFSDVDGDGHEDVIVSGQNNANSSITKLYLNDGDGNFTEDTSASFVGVSYSSIAFSDVDGDGDLDVLISGQMTSGTHVTKLYLNDGDGNFTEDTSIPFDGVRFGTINFSDIDGDGDEDVLITGQLSTGVRIAKLYLNDGNGNFTEDTSAPFDGIRFGSIAFSDVNGNGVEDLLYTGQTNSDLRISKLYINDGDGNFTEDTSAPFEGVRNSSVAFSDVDGDGDLDVVITGQTQSLQHIAKLYLNDGDGNFTEDTSVPFDGVWRSSIAFSDVNGNGNEDVLITGQNSDDLQIAKLYLNDGNGNFTEDTSVPFIGVWWGYVAFSDIDGDGYEDLLISGQDSSELRITKLYLNDGNGSFQNLPAPSIGVRFGTINFSDIDGDGDEDVLITGQLSTGVRIAKLYLNDGNGNFTEDTSVPFEGVRFGSIAFADVNGNGHEDVLITGQNDDDLRVSKLYLNDGNGSFSEDTSVSFEGVRNSSIAFSDVDGDGDQDVLITGQTNTEQRVTKLYINDGNGNFSEDTSISMDGVWRGSIAFSDVDGDGDEDVLITGQNSANQRIAKLYLNDGNGNFSEDTSVAFDGIWWGEISFSDVNGNGHEDVVITGENSASQRTAKLYLNDGNGNFSEDTSVPFVGVRYSSVAFTDIDGDGDMDVLISGERSTSSSSSAYFSRLYLNDGNGNFTEDTSVPFVGVRHSAVAFSDIDNDGDQDVFITGQIRSTYARITRLYRNLTNNFNWVGAVNTEWSNANNWQPNAIPQNNSIVVIPDASNQPIINTTDHVEVSGLTVHNNSTLSVEGDLKVANRINNNGQITFKSTEDKTGQLDEFSGTYSGSGIVEVERFIPEGQRAFRFISPSVTTTSSIYENWQENGASPIGFGTHITGSTAGANGFDATTTGNPSMFEYNNLLENQSGGQAWEPIDNTNVNTLVAGKPARLFVRGDRTTDLTSNESLANETTLRARGDLHVGNFDPVLSPFDANFSFVGNPYQATVDIKELNYGGDINNNYIYVWDAQQGSAGAYVTIDLLDGSNTVGSNANEFIQPSQAFFIRNNMSVTTSPSITFTESAKRVDQEQLSTFSTTDFAKLNLQLFNNNEQIADAIGLRFSENFQNEVNDADAGKLGNAGENFALVSSNQLLSIEQRQMPLLGEEIQLFINNYQNQNYKLLLHTEQWDEDLTIFIKDAYADQLTLIEPGTEFAFDVDTNNAGSSSPFRFSLIFGNETFSDNNFDEHAFSVYPNPAKENLYVSGIKSEAKISITNLMGQEILSFKKINNNDGLDIAKLSSGMYIIHIKEDQIETTKKFIKN